MTDDQTASGDFTPDSASWSPPRLSVAAWATYDLANTIFALGVGSLYFADWLTEQATELPGFFSRFEEPADLALALALNIAMLVVIVLSPWIGARSDHRGRRLRYLFPMTILAVVPTFFIATVGVTASLGLFIVALIGFNLGSVIYDALLPDVSTPDNVGVVSGLGIGIGYVGSFIAVLLGLVLLDDHGEAVVFQAIAVLFLVFSIPTFLFVEERPRPGEVGPPPTLRSSARRLVQAWRKASGYPGVTRFLVGRFLYTDAVNTLIGGFLTIYVVEELGFDDAQVQSLLGVAIVGAIAGGFAGGRLVDRHGPRRVLHAVLWAWVVAIGSGIVAGVADVGALVWPLGVLGGFSLGATWAADRVYMQRISPPRHLGEFYGLYATVGRFATILGPLIWGVIVTVFGFPRELALGVLIGFIIAARIVLERVDDGVREWDEADLSPR